MSCECPYCETNRKIEAAKSSRNPDKLIDTLGEVRSELIYTQDELCKANAIIKGVWPDSDKLIKEVREGIS